MPKNYTNSELATLPKADLHVHLDGSVRLETLIDLARKLNVKLPSYTVEGLKETVFKDQYADLVEYLKGFDYICAALADLEGLERVAYEFAHDCYRERIYYVEPRYCPELFKNPEVSSFKATNIMIINAIDKGLEKAKFEINLSKRADEPEFTYGHIICAMRHWPEKQVIKYMQEIAAIKTNSFLPIVGVDLAGPEKGFPCRAHQAAFELPGMENLARTIHAGEADGPKSIEDAIRLLKATRIGHGFHLYSDAYSYANNDELIKYIKANQIAIEVNITSNLQTMPELENDPKRHTVKKMIDDGQRIAICTDNRTVSSTSLTYELLLLQETFDLDKSTMNQIIMNAFEGIFYPGFKREREQYINSVRAYLTNLVNR
jgi:adenosine deaminase